MCSTTSVCYAYACVICVLICVHLVHIWYAYTCAHIFVLYLCTPCISVMHKHVHTYLYTYLCISVMHKHVHTYLHTYLCTLCVYICYAYTCVHIFVYLLVYTLCVYLLCIYLCAHICIPTCVHLVCISVMHILVHTYLCTNMCASIIHGYKYVCAYLCISVIHIMHKYLYIYIYIYKIYIIYTYIIYNICIYLCTYIYNTYCMPTCVNFFYIYLCTITCIPSRVHLLNVQIHGRIHLLHTVVFKRVCKLHSRVSLMNLVGVLQDSDLRSALLLEQAAHCFINMQAPMVRKFSFHMILAGHRFGKAGQVSVSSLTPQPIHRWTADNHAATHTPYFITK